jgi:hypothetical protein
VEAFTNAMAAGYRVIAVVVLIGAGFVHRGLARREVAVADRTARRAWVGRRALRGQG